MNVEDDYLSSLNDGTIYKEDIKMANKFTIQDFDPQTMKKIEGHMLICAMTGSGKSQFLMYLLSLIYKEYDTIYLFSKTACAQELFMDYFDRGSVFDDFNEEFLAELWHKQKAEKEINIKAKQKRILLLFDDIINSPAYKKSVVFADLMTGGRNYKLNIIFITQNMSSVPVLYRNNFRYAVAFDIDSFTERDKFVNQYMSSINKRVGHLLFKKVVKEKPYQCIIVEIYKNGQPIENKIKKFVANLKFKKFKIKNKVEMEELMDQNLKVVDSIEEQKPHKCVKSKRKF